jgi:hypothetical protein
LALKDAYFSSYTKDDKRKNNTYILSPYLEKEKHERDNSVKSLW